MTAPSENPRPLATIGRIVGIALSLLLMFFLVSAQPVRPPNFIIILVDDMGYGDIGCFGSTKNRTPNIDQMAAQGMKFTDFYVAASVCSPSRAALLTGCYPQRVNLHQDEKGWCVLYPGSPKGLNPREVTIAEVLKKQGYRTAHIGKWHVGDQRKFLPVHQGFDYYFGIPYSNDMDHIDVNGHDIPGNPLPLVRNDQVIEAPADQDTLTQRYTEETITFIRENKSRPFFIYLAYAMVHVPLHASQQFRGKSNNGLYGDAVEEIDWSTGEILKTLKKLGLDDQTLVIFTSDNGSLGEDGGSNGPLRGIKGQTFEGGMRMPCVMRYPGKIPAGTTSSAVAGTIDLLPTFACLAGTKPPQRHRLDGQNIWPLMSGQHDAKSPHEAMFYYQMDQLQCVRSGRWKLHLALQAKKRNWGPPEGPVPLQLFDLETDIHEDRDVSAAHPEVVHALLVLAEQAKADLGDVGIKGTGQRPAGWVKNPKPMLLPKSKS